MSDTVVDSSVAAKWLVPEPDSAQAQRLITEVAMRGERLIVLDLAVFEVANVIWTRYHRHLATLAQVHELLDRLLASPVHIEPAGPLLRAAMDVATRYDRAVYDALFVALTLALSLPGVTADEPLYHAVHKDHPNIVLLRDW